MLGIKGYLMMLVSVRVECVRGMHVPVNYCRELLSNVSLTIGMFGHVYCLWPTADVCTRTWVQACDTTQRGVQVNMISRAAHSENMCLAI